MTLIMKNITPSTESATIKNHWYKTKITRNNSVKR